MADGNTKDFILYELEHLGKGSTRTKEQLPDVLETAPSMVLRFDQEFRVVRAHDAAIFAKGVDGGDLLGQLCGDAVKCVNACLEKGCGNEEPCSDCSLRRTIEETFKTGDGCYKQACKLTLRNDDGHDESLDFLVTTALLKDDENNEVIARLENISAQRIAAKKFLDREKMAQIFKARAHLFDYASYHTLDELLVEALNSVEELTESKIAFFHFVDRDQKNLSLQCWSSSTQKDFCRASGKGLHYSISKAGVWAEAFYERRPIIHNDYEALTNKKGFPDGHANVTRELVVPVLRDDRVTALMGVGNKERDYDEEDARLLSRFADLVWDIADRKRSSLHIEHLNNVLRAIRNVNQLIVRENDIERLLEQTCNEMVDCRGASCAWIVTNDKQGLPAKWARAGLSESLDKLVLLFESRQWPPCRDELLERQSVQIVVDEKRLCSDCLASFHNDSEKIIITKLAYQGSVYGLMGLKLPSVEVIDDDERALLIEVAGDLAFALWSIANEVEKSQLEAQLLQSQKMEAIGRLAGGIAHDFNNLLTIINSNADFVLSELNEDNDLKLEIQEILDAGERAALLTKQLLTFSRQQVVEPRAIDINIVIENLERMLVRVIGEDVELRTSLASDLGAIMADPNQIEQILMNLVVNARDAMPKGGSLLIKTESKDCDGQKLVVISVTDTGEGIDDKALEHIFEPFFTTKTKGKGTGLGLSTVFGIVRQFNGEIRVNSTLGFGSTFQIRFPRVNALPENVQPKDREKYEIGNETILVVEDEPILQGLCKRMLTSAGYKVLVAGNGIEALTVYKKYKDKISLVLTDVVMPKLDGIGLVKELDALGAKCGVLYMSGYVGDPVSDGTSSSMTTDFIAKPFNRQSLLQKIRQVIERRD